MSRIPRIIRTSAIAKDTWTKIFDENDYQKNRIKEITVKLSETTTADHFRYNYDGSTTQYKTSTSGVTMSIDCKQFWIYVPDVDSQIAEIEIFYK